MAPIIKPGDGLLYMKVGTHAQEGLDEIIERKRNEIKDAGFALWGYGGNTCHPVSMVQPFARTYKKRAGVIYLCMEPMTSRHFAEPLRARDYSIDGVTWTEVPQSINVLGSRYALVIKELRREEFDIPLDNTKVAIGNCVGRIGSEYIAGRVDKACLELINDGEAASAADRIAHIGLVAEIVDPFAVFMRE
jgi:hypothetical protein